MGLEDIPLKIVTSKQVLNSLEKIDVIPQTVYCNKKPQIEEGLIKIEIKRGLINFPRLIPFKIPTNSKLEKDEKNDVLSQKHIYDESKGLVTFIDCHKLPPSQKFFSFSFKYIKNIELNEIENKIECIERETSNGKEITVKNKTNIQFINFIIKSKIQLPKKRFSSINELRKKDITKFILINNRNQNKISFDIGNIYMSGKEICLFCDIFWFENINPNETKVFNIKLI